MMSDSMTALHMGDEQTYDLLFKKLYKPLCFFAFKIVKDQEKAEDIVQDCFLKLWISKKTFSKFEYIQSYLYMSIKNACFDELEHLKVISKYMHHAQQEPLFSEENVLDLIMHTEVLRKVLNAVETLPEKCKQVIQLTYNEGKSPKEIAEELGVTVSTVTNQKLRGIAILKQLLYQPEITLIAMLLTSTKDFYSS